MVDDQRDADPDLVDVGAEALGVKLAELGPVPADPHMGLLRDLARAVLEAAADEEREAGMVATRVRSAPGPAGEWDPADEAAARAEVTTTGPRARAQQGVPVDLVGWAVAVVSNVDAPAAGWPQQTGEWRTAARQWLDAIATQALVPDGERHPNEQPGRRMSPGQRSLAAAVLEDMAGWCESHAEVVGGFEADGIGDVVAEIERRARQGHVGPAVARWLLEHGQDDPGPSLAETDPKLIGALVVLAQEYGLRGVTRTATLMLARGDKTLAPAEPVDPPVNRRPNQVAALEDGFMVSKPPGMAQRDSLPRGSDDW